MPLGITETKRPEENYFWEVTIPGFSGKHMTYRCCLNGALIKGGKNIFEFAT